MTIAWLQNGKQGSALMGNVIEENENSYVVLVTSWESKRFEKYQGQKVVVQKNNCKVMRGN